MANDSIRSQMGNWSLFYHTARNMQPRQLWGVVERHMRHMLVPHLPIDFDARYERLIPDVFKVDTSGIQRNLDTLRSSLSQSERQKYRERARKAADGKITFLNEPIDFGSSGSLNWEHERIDDYPLLWRLKLQSFEVLRWLVLGFDRPTDETSALIKRFNEWIADWSNRNQIGQENYLRRNWIPHSVSLRVINWCRYYAWSNRTEQDVTAASESGEKIGNTLKKEIYKNSLFLKNHIEYDIGGNHLIENAAALIITGCFFDGHENGWLETGLQVLSDSSSQFLSDGGHFERSPMYHIQTLKRYLTAIDLLERMNRGTPAAISKTATNGIAFLKSIRPPDGSLPLLNDSVFGETVSLQSCLRYANAVGVSPEKTRSSLPQTGYYWIGNDPSRLLVDGGSVGPPHLPAHSHNDMLSILLWVDNERILTDTGVYQYEADEARRYARSVAAHNTVQVDQYEPIPIGGKYLMGRRCFPTSCIRGDSEDGLTHFVGGYERKRLGKSVYEHRRDIISGDGWWFITDAIEGDGDDLCASLHFHPDVEIEQNGGGYSFQRNKAEGVIKPVGTSAITETYSWYFPRFGERIKRDSLRLSYDHGNSVNGFVVSLNPDADFFVEGYDGESLIVTIDGTQHEVDRSCAFKGGSTSWSFI